MSTQNINVTVNDVDIDVTVGDTEINLTVASVATANFISENNKFYFNGRGGDCYMMYNSVTEKLEVWVNGIKQSQWGAGGNPFA